MTHRAITLLAALVIVAAAVSTAWLLPSEDVASTTVLAVDAPVTQVETAPLLPVVESAPMPEAELPEERARGPLAQDALAEDVIQIVRGRVQNFQGDAIAQATVAVTLSYDRRGLVQRLYQEQHRVDSDGAYELSIACRSVPQERSHSLILRVNAPGYREEITSRRRITPGTAPVEMTFSLTPEGVLRGRVLAKDGRPAHRVQVSLWDGSGKLMSTVRCQDDGHYILELRRSGRFHLTAISYRDGTLRFGPVALDAFHSRTLPTLYLNKGGVLAGVVRTPDEQPVAGLAINAYSTRFRELEDQDLPPIGTFSMDTERLEQGIERASVVSDPSGRFRISGLLPGRYFFTTRTAAVGVDRRQYETGNETIELEVRDYRLLVNVVNHQGKPVPRSSVHVAGPGGFARTTAADATGTVVVRVTPGDYVISAGRSGYAPREVRTAVSSRDFQKPITLQLSPATTTGSIRFELIGHPDRPIPQVWAVLRTRYGKAKVEGVSLPLLREGDTVDRIPVGEYSLLYRVPWAGDEVQFYMEQEVPVQVEHEQTTDLILAPSEGGRISIEPHGTAPRGLWDAVDATFQPDGTGSPIRLHAFYQMRDGGGRTGPVVPGRPVNFHQLLEPGSGTLRIKFDGYHEVVRSVVIRPAAVTNVTVFLRPDR